MCIELPLKIPDKRTKRLRTAQLPNGYISGDRRRAPVCFTDYRERACKNEAAPWVPRRGRTGRGTMFKQQAVGRGVSAPWNLRPGGSCCFPDSRGAQATKLEPSVILVNSIEGLPAFHYGSLSGLVPSFVGGRLHLKLVCGKLVGCRR